MIVMYYDCLSSPKYYIKIFADILIMYYTNHIQLVSVTTELKIVVLWLQATINIVS